MNDQEMIEVITKKMIVVVDKNELLEIIDNLIKQYEITKIKFDKIKLRYQVTISKVE